MDTEDLRDLASAIREAAGALAAEADQLSRATAPVLIDVLAVSDALDAVEAHTDGLDSLIRDMWAQLAAPRRDPVAPVVALAGRR